jgi:hypothetical protein
MKKRCGFFYNVQIAVKYQYSVVTVAGLVSCFGKITAETRIFDMKTIIFKNKIKKIEEGVENV